MSFYAVQYLVEVGNTPAGTRAVIHDNSALFRRGAAFPAVECLHQDPFGTRAEAEEFLRPPAAKPKAKRSTKAAPAPVDEPEDDAAAALAALQADADEDF